jgi:hypothetical protein
MKRIFVPTLEEEKDTSELSSSDLYKLRRIFSSCVSVILHPDIIDDISLNNLILSCSLGTAREISRY